MQLPWFFALLATLGLAACSRPEAAPEPLRAVRVLTVGLEPMQASYQYAADVRARQESNLGFRVGGKLIRREAEVGQRVKAGQLLAELDPQDYQLAVQAARTQVAAAQTNRDLAAVDYARYQALKAQNFISGAELDRRSASLKAAQAQLEQAQAQSQVQSNQAGYSHLRADVSGVVTAVLAEPGQVVAAGTPVLRLAKDGPRDAVFSVPEDKVGALRLGSQVLVGRWAQPGQMAGTVREVAAMADPVTRTYLVKVALEGTDMPPLGSTLHVQPLALSHAGTEVIKLPTSALRQDGQASAVWLLDKATMTLRSQPVQIATADGNEAVIGAGLKPGDVVVSAGVHVLAPGQKVSIYQENPAGAGVDTTFTATKKIASSMSATASATAAGAGK